jgi:hypothetical protein
MNLSYGVLNLMLLDLPLAHHLVFSAQTATKLYGAGGLCRRRQTVRYLVEYS